MAYDISECCRLHFDLEATQKYPAKIDPMHQKVAFSNDREEVVVVILRSNLEKIQSNTEEYNDLYLGISGAEAFHAYIESDYARLRPEISDDVKGFIQGVEASKARKLVL